MISARAYPARAPRGFALVAVLWVLTGMTIVGLGLGLASRSAVDVTQNRLDLLRARWRAEGCVERARSIIDAALYGSASSSAESRTRVWRRLDAVVAESPQRFSCDLRLQSSGTRLDVNTDSTSRLRRFLGASGIESENVDSLLAALEDWRDADDDVRPGGAERAWYESRYRPSPRNDRLRSVAELGRVRGFESLGGLDSSIGTEPERIVLDRAPAAVLASLPGVGEEAVARLIDSRLSDDPINDVPRLADALTPGARAALLSHFAELSFMTASSPDVWTVTARAVSGPRGISVLVAVRLVDGGTRTAVVRRRVWP